VAFQSAFLGLMPHSVAIASWAGYSTDGYGTPSYGAAATTVRARVVARQQRVLQRDGSEVAGNHVAWLATTMTITLRDRFTFEGSTMEILSVARYPDHAGLHHQMLTLRQRT